MTSNVMLSYTTPPEEPELREGVVEQETVCSTHTAPPGEPELSIVDVPPNPTTEQECSFKRGKCQIHNVKGTKNKSKRQKLMKKKNGIFGFITVHSVFYTCTARKETW